MKAGAVEFLTTPSALPDALARDPNRLERSRISEITVKQHRGRMMRKMRARSLPELVTIASRLGLATAGKG